MQLNMSQSLRCQYDGHTVSNGVTLCQRRPVRRSQRCHASRERNYVECATKSNGGTGEVRSRTRLLPRHMWCYLDTLNLEAHCDVTGSLFCLQNGNSHGQRQVARLKAIAVVAAACIYAHPALAEIQVKPDLSKSINHRWFGMKASVYQSPVTERDFLSL